MTDRTPGIDVSHWQGNIDWQKVALADVRFVFIRATNGESGTDRQFTNNWQGAEAVGLLRGVYHYYRPDQDPVAQANHMIDVAGTDAELPYVLDLEERDGIRDTLRDDGQRFLERVFVNDTGTTEIYTSPAFWSEKMRPAPWAAAYDLWIANYTSAPEPIVPAPWEQWTFWQYTDSGDGLATGAESLGLDLNRFAGSLEDLHTYVGLQPPSTDETPSSETTTDSASDRVRVITSALNARKGPGTSLTSIGQVGSGDSLEVVERKIDSSNNEWVAVKLWVAGTHGGREFVEPE